LSIEPAFSAEILINTIGRMRSWGMDGSTEQRDDAAWFRRFRFTPVQKVEIRQQVERNRQAVSASTSALELLSNLLELTWALTPLDQEAEAVIIGERGLELARAHMLVEMEIEALLHTATAVQYSGDRQRADDLFEEAVRLVSETGEEAQLHFLLHHHGRLKAEMGDLEVARSLFEGALLLRKQFDDARLVASTQQALTELETWCTNQSAEPTAKRAERPQ
jgi:tetratricopeptide (TPR) repeat protein